MDYNRQVARNGSPARFSAAARRRNRLSLTGRLILKNFGQIGHNIGGEPTLIQIEIGKKRVAADTRHNGGNALLEAGAPRRSASQADESGKLCA